MLEPSEAWLDWQFRNLLVTCTEEDLKAACASDRVIMERWLQIFNEAPPSQKAARNTLMILMHDHVEQFRYLRAPFTDARNCKRDMNQVIKGCRGISQPRSLRHSSRSKGIVAENKEPKRLAAGRSACCSSSVSLKRVSGRTQLDPIKEVTEPSIVQSSVVTVVSRKNPAQECDSDSPRALPVASQSVREKVQALEEMSHSLRAHSTQNVPKNTLQSCGNDAKASSSNADVRRPSQEPQSERCMPGSGSCNAKGQLALSPLAHSKQIVPKDTQSNDNDAEASFSEDGHRLRNPSCGFSSSIRKLRNCFQEISECLKTTSAIDSPVLGKIRASVQPPEPPKTIAHGRTSEEDLDSKPLPSSDQSIPISYQQDRDMMNLLRRREEVRLQCLEYYNLDGTLKDDKELPAPTSVPDKKVQGFSIGAYRAMERLRRWRGKPNQLKFFGSICRECGLEGDLTGRVRALDRRFEHVALQWLRSTRRRCPSGSSVELRPPLSLEELIERRNQLEEQKTLKKEYMAHLDEIRKLCETHCRGVIGAEVLEKMLQCVDKQYQAISEDVSRLTNQLEEML